MTTVYDNRIFNARGNTTFALDADMTQVHLCWMDTAAAILTALKAKGITQAEIADVLGVAQPNVATLYKPAKNGKLRKLSYDEGKRLIEAFELSAADHPALNDKALAPILQALVPLAPSSGLSEKAAEALSQALVYALELLPKTGAKEPSPGELAMAARAAVSRFREAGFA